MVSRCISCRREPSDRHADARRSIGKRVAGVLRGKRAPRPVRAVLRSLIKNTYINRAAQLGGLIDRQVAQQMSQADLGVKQAAFYVLRGADMPAI